LIRRGGHGRAKKSITVKRDKVFEPLPPHPDHVGLEHEVVDQQLAPAVEERAGPDQAVGWPAAWLSRCC
jgi:hypothetical protein